MKILSAILTVLKKINAIIDKILLAVCVLVFLTIIVVILASIASRSPLTPFSPLGWPEELSVFLFISLAFLGASCAAYRRREIVVDFMLAKIPAKATRPLNIAIRVMIIGLLVIIVYAGVVLYPGILGYTMALRIPRSWHFLPLVVSAASMTLINFADLLELIVQPQKEAEKGVE